MEATLAILFVTAIGLMLAYLDAVRAKNRYRDLFEAQDAAVDRLLLTNAELRARIGADASGTVKRGEHGRFVSVK